MELDDLLSGEKAAILTRWFDLILAGYPSDSQRFLKKQKNPFANPVGTTIQRAMEALYEELLKGKGPERLSTFLDHMIRIRAVQDFSPTQAIEFIFQLKEVIREKL